MIQRYFDKFISLLHKLMYKYLKKLFSNLNTYVNFSFKTKYWIPMLTFPF